MAYKKPAYDLKTTGVYKFKTKDKEYILKVTYFERESDTQDSLAIQDDLRGELGSINIKNASWNKLSKGETIRAVSSKGDTGMLTRIDDISNFDKYEKGGEFVSMYDSTKQKMKDKTEQERIDTLIDYVKQSNWSSKEITVKDNMVIVFSRMYDLEPTRVASIFNKYQKKSNMAKGGTLSKSQLKHFKEWMEDGNVSKNNDGTYSTQDAQFRNKLKNLNELKKYFKKEFAVDEYATGGGVGEIEYKIGDIFEGNPKATYEENWQLFKPLKSYVIDNKTNKIVSIHKTPYEAIEKRNSLDKNFKLHYEVKPKEFYNKMKTGGGVGGKLKKSKVNITNDMRGEDSDDYGTFEIYKNGGSVDVKVVNSDKQYNEKQYDWILGDKDKDSVANADDVKPLDKNIKERIDEPTITTGIKNLISLKKSLDSTMYSFIEDLKNVAPNKSTIYARTKTPYSVLDKLIKKRLSTITDLIGTTIVTNDKKELDIVKNYVESGKMGKVVEMEDMYEKPKQGYRAYHFLIERNGMTIELQVKTKRQKALNELSHEPYKLGKLNSTVNLKMTELANRADEGDKNAIKEYNDFMNQPNLEKLFYADGGNKMAHGGKIENQYFSKTPKEVYELWDYGQKYEFFKDHFENLGTYSNSEYKRLPSKKYDELDKIAKDALIEHIKGGQYAHGGSIEDENREMVLNENNQIIHHTKELPSAIKGKRVPAWVVTKVHESASDLSDATHYMDGQKMAKGGEIGKEINFEYEYAGKSKLKGTGKILSKNGNYYNIMVTKGLMKGKTTDINESMIIGKMANGGNLGDTNKVEIEITEQYGDERGNKKNAPKTYDVNYIVTFPNKDFIELTGTLKPYNTGRDYDYEFEVDYFAEEKEENYYDENSENIEKEILDKFYNKKENTNKMEKGGKVYFKEGRDADRIGIPQGDIEKEILERVKYFADNKELFVGNFGWRTPKPYEKLADGYLYKLEEYDLNLIKDIKLKSGEKVFRYFNRTSAIGGSVPFIKINLDKGLLYWTIDNENDEIKFDTKGYPALWVNILSEKMANGGGVHTMPNGEIMLDSAHYGNGGAVGEDDNLLSFTIPTWAVSSLVNGDDSGLEDEDIEKLNKFLDKTVSKYGNAFFMIGSDEDMESEFSYRNDIDGTLGGDVVTMYLRPERMAKGGNIDKPLSFYKYDTKRVKMAWNGKIQIGAYYSAEECMEAIKKQANTKEELSHYSIITPDKTIHLGKEYDIKYANGGGLGSEIEELWQGYAEAVLFTEEEELGSDYSIYDFDEKTESSTKKMLATYYNNNKKAIEESELSLDVIGNDIWYTRSGQGAGFFDHSLDDEIEKQLTDGAKAMGEFPSVEIHNGKVSIRGGKVFADGGEMGKEMLKRGELIIDGKKTTIFEVVKSVNILYKGKLLRNEELLKYPKSKGDEYHLSDLIFKSKEDALAKFNERINKIKSRDGYEVIDKMAKGGGVGEKGGDFEIKNGYVHISKGDILTLKETNPPIIGLKLTFDELFALQRGKATVEIEEKYKDGKTRKTLPSGTKVKINYIIGTSNYGFNIHATTEDGYIIVEPKWNFVENSLAPKGLWKVEKENKFADGGEVSDAENKQLWYVTDVNDNVKNISTSIPNAQTFLSRIGNNGSINYVKVPLSDWNAEKVNVSNIKQYAKKMWQSYEKGGKLNLNTYKLRAEGLNDFLSFLQNDMYMRVKSFTIEPIGVPDVVVTFVTDASLSEIKSKLKEVQDSHVMLETIKPINKYTGKRYEHGGLMDSQQGIDLFEDNENIPANVQSILDNNEDAFMDGDYKELQKALTQLKKIGYTFEFDLDGQAYDLRPIGTKGKSEMEDGEEMAKGGEIGDFNVGQIFEVNRNSEKAQKYFDTSYGKGYVFIISDIFNEKGFDENQFWDAHIKLKVFDSNLKYRFPIRVFFKGKPYGLNLTKKLFSELLSDKTIFPSDNYYVEKESDYDRKERESKGNGYVELIKRKINPIWKSIIDKFGEIYFSDGTDDDELVSDQVKAEEYEWQFDRYSKYASPLSWADAEAKFKKSLTADELNSIEISYKKEEYADLEEHDTEKYHKQIFVKLKPMDALNSNKNQTTMTQEEISKLVKGANGTNETARNFSIKKLKEAGLNKNGKPIERKKAMTKINTANTKKIEKGFKNPSGMLISNNPEVRSAVAKHTKSIIDNLHKNRKEEASKTTEDYDCDEIIAEALKRKKNAKKSAEKSANKPEVVKATNKVEKTHDAIEKQIEAGKLKKAQIEKIIAETEDLLKMLKKALKSL